MPRRSTVGGTYQAPYYGDTSGTKYEPSGNASPSDGSDLPDYVTFCLNCHQYEQFDPDNNNRTVKAIDYSQERHGSYPSNDCTSAGFGEGSLTAPYIDSPDSNYVLSCLDCHEPHGAKKRQHLIRRMINGQEVVLDSKDQYGNCYDDFAVICEKCHEFSYDHLSWGGCQGAMEIPPDFMGLRFHLVEIIVVRISPVFGELWDLKPCGRWGHP
jgi:Zn-finger protein